MHTRTGHSSVDAPDVGKQRDLGKLSGECGRLVHLLLEDLGALARGVERGDVQLGKGGPRAVSAGEHDMGVVEYELEQVELHVLAREWLSIVALDGEGLAAVVADAAGRASIPGVT